MSDRDQNKPTHRMPLSQITRDRLLLLNTTMVLGLASKLCPESLQDGGEDNVTKCLREAYEEMYGEEL